MRLILVASCVFMVGSAGAQSVLSPEVAGKGSQPISQADPLLEDCRNALRAHMLEKALPACRKAVESALAAGDQTRKEQLTLVEDHVSYGRALMDNRKLPDALAEENNAISEARKCLEESDQELAVPYFWRGVASVRLAKYNDALADFQHAEAIQRKAIAAHPDKAKVYSAYLATILLQHATLLSRIGRSQEAERLRQEASAL